MSNNIHFYLTFFLNTKNKLVTIVSAKWKDEEINLSKSSFMLFLYNNESEIDEKDLDFSYRLSKYLKKVRIGNDVHDALAQDSDVGWFLSRIDELDINVKWRQIIDNETSEFKPLLFDELIPIQIELNQDKSKIECILKNRLEWLQTHLLWMPFPSENGLYCFSNGIIKRKTI